ncbi:FliA/WhiG family RNA polymerase sigma factor, partial [Vibrio natriegens]
LGTDKEDYQQRLHASLASEMQSLDQLIENGADMAHDNHQDAIQHEQIKRTLEVALTKLKQREQLLLTLFYQHDMNLHEIALVL